MMRAASPYCATYAWFRNRISGVHGAPLEEVLPKMGNVDAFSPFGAMLYYLHKDSISVLELHPHNNTDMSLYWQLDNKNVLPEDMEWAECVVDAKVKEHPGVLMASGKWARNPPEIDAYKRVGDRLANVERWYKERVEHGQWHSEDAAEFGPCGPPPFVIKQQLEAKAAATLNINNHPPDSSHHDDQQ